MTTSIGFDIFARDRASGPIKKVGDAADTSARKFSGWSALAGGAITAVGAGLFKFASDSVGQYKEAQASQDRLADAFTKFPALADTNISSLQALNTQLEAKTKFDDDATAAGQATLAQFKLTGTQIEKLTPLMQDYAAKTGKSLPDAAKDLGKALLGQGKALKEVGLKFTDLKDPTKNFDQLMGGLRTQVGGFAEKEGKTGAGQSEILKNQFGELQETVGSKLLPVLMGLTRGLLSVVGFMQDHTTVVKVAAVTVGGLVAVYGTLMGVQRVQTALTLLQTEGTLAHSLAQKAAALGTGVVTAAQWAWNAALSANPIGLVVIAIAALVGGLVFAYQHSETFRNIVQGAFRAVGEAGRWLWDNALRPAFALIAGMWLSVVGGIVNGAAAAFGWVPGIGPRLQAAAGKFGEFRDQVNAALAGTRSSVSVRVSTPGSDAAISALAELRRKAYGIPTGVTIGVLNKLGHLPGMNAGGTSSWRGGLTWVGERGPELVDLPRGTAIHSNADSMTMVAGAGSGGGGGGVGAGVPVIQVSVSGVVGDHTAVARALAPALRDALAEMARNGARLGFA